MPRRRLHPPWIPGLPLLAAFLLLLACIFGFYYALAVFTKFDRAKPSAPAAAPK